MRSEYKQPDAADVLPPPDAIVVAPATFDTIDKWPAGIGNTLALGLLTEAVGKRLPVVARRSSTPPKPSIRPSRPGLIGSEPPACSCYGPNVLELHEPGTGGQRVGLYPVAVDP